jgi:hypothetical protein
VGADTEPNVFVIESNSERDERRQFSEGRIICDVLNMMGKHAEYRYIRTRKELDRMLQQFSKSQFRYLHIACHGGDNSFALTLDNVPYRDFSRMAEETLSDRRIFLSVCEIANSTLAREVYSTSRPYSITGPTCEILFSDAAVVWASLYSLLFKQDPGGIQGGTIREYLADLCKLHRVTFAHFGRIGSAPWFKRHALGNPADAVVRARLAKQAR